MNRSVMRYLIRNPAGLAGICMLAVILFITYCLPLMIDYQPAAQRPELALRAPDRHFLCGTDYLGRDLLSRLIEASRITLGVSLRAACLALAIGCLVGGVAGLTPPFWERQIVRLIDLFIGFPKLFVILLVVGLTRPSLGLIIVIMGSFSWMETARIVRAEVAVRRHMPFIQALVALGQSSGRIYFRHLLPNIAGPVLTSLALLIGSLILVESGLSFIGLGVQPPLASWGTILNQARLDPTGAWWLALFPGVLILLTVIGFNLIGDSLQHHLQRQDSSTDD